MRKTFTVLLLAAVLAVCSVGCSDDYDYAEPATRASGGTGGEDIPEGLYYDEETGMWLIPLEDQKEIVCSGTETGIMSTQFSFTPTPSPEPTPWEPGVIIPQKMVVGHYLKIWPQNQEQLEYLFAIENDDLIISYHSFNTIPAPTSLLNSLGIVNGTPSVNWVRFYEYEEEYEDSSGDVLPARHVPMPVLYADWPISLTYPDWMVYEVIEEKVVWFYFETPGSGPPAEGGSGGSNSTTTPYKPRVTVKAWDSVLNRYVNIPHVPIFIQASYSNYEKGRTDANGQYQCKNTYTKSNKFTVTVDWDHWDFYIIKNEKLAQYTYQTYPDNTVLVQMPENVHATIFRAAEWFADNKAIHKLRASFGFPGDKKIRIYDKTHLSKSESGTFHTNASKCRISMYNQGTNYFNYFQTTMHELGHASMARGKGKWRYGDTGSMIKDGWASFVAWYMTPLAYRCWGYYGPLDIKTRQDWQSIGVNNDKYSGLFIDLMDDDNQYMSLGKGIDTTYPDDCIKNVPVLVIQSISQNSYACASFEREARKYIRWGTKGYYTEQEFNDYFRAYDEGWVYGGTGL